MYVDCALLCIFTMDLLVVPGPGGGGYSVWKRVPTAIRLLESGPDPRRLKRGGCPYILL